MTMRRTLVAVLLVLGVSVTTMAPAMAAQDPGRPGGPSGPPPAGVTADPCERVTNRLEQAEESREHAEARLTRLQDRLADARAAGDDELVERLEHRIARTQERIEHLTERIQHLTERQAEFCADEAA